MGGGEQRGFSLRVSGLLIVAFLFAVVMVGCIFLIGEDDSSDAVSDDSGSCGDNVTYTFDSATKTLTISGTGRMKDYSAYGSPWYSYADSIKSIEIKNSVTTIGSYAFYSCISLTSVTIPDSVTTIGIVAFYGCTSLTSVTIPDSVTTIGNAAFSLCSSLTSVTIPDSVTTVGILPFGRCTKMTLINVDTRNPYYCSIDGVLFNKNKTELIQYPAGKVNSTYNIPNSVTIIGNAAFSGCESLTSVTIPNSVTSIESFAFDGCTSLTSVTIPNSVTSIGYYAFEYCTSLTSVTIGDSVTTIGNHAFYMCKKLTFVAFNSSQSIGDNAFYGITFYDTDGTTELEPTAQNLAGHTFKGTDAKLIKVGSAPIKQSFSITFTFPDGTSSVKSYLEGETITEPSYSSKTGYTLYWTKDGAEFTFPATMPSYSFELKAVWKANKYTITFKNWDGTILNSSSYDYGTNVIYSGPTPTRDSDEQWDYTFNGWDRPLSIVTEDTTYTAQYISKAKQPTSAQYTIIFKNWDGSILSSKEYESGTVASDIAIPTATKDSDSEYTYTFKGWSPEISDVNADAEYIAIFDKIARGSDENNDSNSISPIVYVAIGAGVTAAIAGVVFFMLRRP